MQETAELTFAVLSDPGNQIAGKLGILTAPADDVRVHPNYTTRTDVGQILAAAVALG